MNKTQQDIVTYGILAIAFLWFLLMLGPVTLLIMSATILALALLRASPALAGMVAATAAFIGIVSYKSIIAWFLAPINMMQDYYVASMPPVITLLFKPYTFNTFMASLTANAGKWIQTPSLWLAYAPAGAFCGGGAYGLFRLWFKNPLRNLKRLKPMDKIHGKVGDLPSTLINHRTAETADGSVIGTDKYAKPIALSDKAANQHTLVLGTTGSGKTVTVCNIVESAINRGLPLIYIDGKGDYNLALRVSSYAQEKKRPVSVFAMRGNSIAYNPLSTGGFTSKKDRIIELREWTEEHYKKLAEGYLQSVFKVMDYCNIPCDLSTLADHLDLKKLKSLVRQNEAIIPDAQDLMDELNHQDQASKSIESLVAEIRNFTASEIGPLFKTQEEKPVLTLANTLAENGIAYFCLPALEFPSMSKTLGRLIVNDLKATMAQQLGQNIKSKVYVVFDEFSVFSGEQVLNVINMGRSAGVHAVLSTQSLSDIASGRKENADHFINQVVGNCNNFILHRQNSPEDAESLAAMIGTRQTLEYTAQVSQMGPTHMGTVRRTRGFIAHPDEIKNLQTGEAFFFSKEAGNVTKMKARMSRI